MAFGENIFNITDLVVCAQSFDGTHTGTAVRLSNGQECSIDPQSEVLEQTGYGLTVELATILTHVDFSMSQGAIDLDAYAILAGMMLTESGATPNQTRESSRAAGGDGLPYFGMIGVGASTGGSNLLIGLPRAKLSNVPSLNMSENEFVVPETEGRGIRNPASSYTNVPFIIRAYETAASVTLTSAYFDTFFRIS